MINLIVSKSKMKIGTLVNKERLKRKLQIADVVKQRQKRFLVKLIAQQRNLKNIKFLRLHISLQIIFFFN